MDRQFIFRADEDLAERLAASASRQERTVSAEIRYALRKHLDDGSVRPTKPGAFKDGEQPASAKV